VVEFLTKLIYLKPEKKEKEFRFCVSKVVTKKGKECRWSSPFSSSTLGREEKGCGEHSIAPLLAYPIIALEGILIHSFRNVD